MTQFLGTRQWVPQRTRESDAPLSGKSQKQKWAAEKSAAHSSGALLERLWRAKRYGVTARVWLDLRALE